VRTWFATPDIAAGMLLLHFCVGAVLAWIGLRRRDAWKSHLRLEWDEKTLARPPSHLFVHSFMALRTELWTLVTSGQVYRCFFGRSTIKTFCASPCARSFFFESSRQCRSYFFSSIPTLGGMRLLRAHFPLLPITEITISHGWPQ